MSALITFLRSDDGACVLLGVMLLAAACYFAVAQRARAAAMPSERTNIVAIMSGSSRVVLGELYAWKRGLGGLFEVIAIEPPNAVLRPMRGRPVAFRMSPDEVHRRMVLIDNARRPARRPTSDPPTRAA